MFNGEQGDSVITLWLGVFISSPILWLWFGILPVSIIVILGLYIPAKLHVLSQQTQDDN